MMGTSGDSGALHFYGSAVLVKVPGVAGPATITKPLATTEELFPRPPSVSVPRYGDVGCNDLFYSKYSP